MSLIRQFVLAAVLLIPCAKPTLAFQEANTTNDLKAMQTELSKLQQTFGKDHPKVVAMQKRIGLVSRLDEMVKDSPNQKAMVTKLYPLMIEEQELLSKFGKDHPKVQLVRARIKLIAEFYSDKDKRNSKAASTSKTAASKRKTKPPAETVKSLVPLLLKEQELIAIYGDKHPRVIRLQKQIEQLRKTLPKGEPRTGGRGPAQGNKPRPDDRSPTVDDDKDKPGRYSMEKKDGNIILLDRETGQSWMLKSERGVSRWIPIRRVADGA